MKKQYISFLFFSLLFTVWTSSAIGQSTGNITGITLDSIEKEVLYGATISLRDSNNEIVETTTSDYTDGHYYLQAKEGIYTVEASYMGYTTSNKRVSIRTGELLKLDILFLEEVNVLQTITKTATRFETPIGKTTISLDVIKPSLVDNTNATKVDEVIDKVPGVTMVDGQANIRGGSGYSYGAGSRVLLLVDDLPLMTGDAGQPNWRDIPVENISQIEVVKGAASALYGSSALNGIINIRTAYAKKKPFTKVSVFQTTFLTPKRAATAWWDYPAIRVWDAADNAAGEADTIVPAFMSGRKGYRKPIELGVQFAHRRKIGKLDLTLGGNYFYSDSYRAGQYDRKFRINSNLRYRFSTKVKAGININVNTGSSASFFIWDNAGLSILNSKLVDTAIYIPRAGSITESQVMRINIDPYFTAYDKKKGRHRLQTRYYFVNNQSAAQSNLSHLAYAEYQYQRIFKIESSFLTNLKLVTGAVGTYTYSKSQLFGNAVYDLGNAAAYVQLEQGLFKEKNRDNAKLNITFGARLEYFTITSPDSILVNPAPGAGLIKNPQPIYQEAKPVFRFGLNYELTPFTFLRASWGQGYRFPTIAERYITTLVGTGFSALAIRANPLLKSETGWSAEIGIKQGFKIGKWKGFADFSLFWTEYQDMMEFTFGGGDTLATGLFFSSINTGGTVIKGLEASIMGTGKIGPIKMNILTGYTFIDPQFQDFNRLQQRLSSLPTKNILKYRATHTFKFDIEAFFLKHDALSLGVSFNYSSKMEAVDRVFEDLFITTPSYEDIFGIKHYRENINSGQSSILGARIGYRYAIHNSEEKEVLALKLSLVGKNLLNQEYMIRPAFVAAPASITVRLDVEF